MTVTAIIVGAGARGKAYSDFALQHPHELHIVGVAEPDETRRTRLATDHQIAPDMIFTDWEALLHSGEKKAAAIFNCTMDRLHFASTLKMLELGYDVLLEKPISPILDENLQLIQKAEEQGRLLQICHVLRFTPFWQKVRDVLDSGVLGRIVNVSHQENLVYWHMTHSFVRGKWRNTATSGPMILTKCCHDFDILYWLLRQKVTSLSSFGALTHFRPENAPAGATQRCTDGCPVGDSCKFNAVTFYANDKDEFPFNTLLSAPTAEARLESLKTDDYGRCVYFCDNDVVDHQVVNMQLEDGTTVTLTMNGHSDEECRVIRVNGTQATLYGKFAKSGDSLRIHHHHNQHIEEVEIMKRDASGHGGGDFGIVRSFIHALTGRPDAQHPQHASRLKVIC